MYESPISVWIGKLETQVVDEATKAVQSCHITINKDELVKALQYDRDQYQKGFEDGKRHRTEAFWEEKEDSGYYYFVCTNCGNESPKIDDDYHSHWLSDYCPNCGARMRGAVGKNNG